MVDRGQAPARTRPPGARMLARNMGCDRSDAGRGSGHGKGNLVGELGVLYYNRKLPKEEVYITWTYAPILAADGQTVDGIFCPCTETTEQVVAREASGELRRLGIRSAETQRSRQRARPQRPSSVKIRVTSLPRRSISWTQRDRRTTVCEGEDPGRRAPGAAHGVADSGQACRSLAAGCRCWRNEAGLETGDLASSGCGSGKPGPNRRTRRSSCRSTSAGDPGRTTGSRNGPAPPWDADYRTFFDLVAGHVGTAISDAKAYEEERRRAEALAEIDRAKTAFFSNVSQSSARRSPMLGPVEDVLARRRWRSTAQTGTS